MRISGGSRRGRSLVRLRGRQIRPSAEKLRQALFDSLAAQRGRPGLDGCRVLDVFAGSGVLGFEALSRGADFVLFLDRDRQALATVRANAVRLGLQGGHELRHRDATCIGRRPDGIAPFDVILLDPPYGRGLGEKALARLAAGGWPAGNAVMVLEEAANAAVTPPPGMRIVSQRRYGDSRLLWLAAADGGKTT